MMEINLKYAANVLSFCRIALLLYIALVYKNAVWFAAIYLFAGITDVMDGAVARKTGTQSEFGARLDSTADLILFFTIVFIMITLAGEKIRMYLPWVFAIIVIRIMNVGIAVVKYHKIVFIHTYANKISGFLIFLCPLIYTFLGKMQLNWLWSVFVLVPLLSAAEETLILMTSDQLDLNRRGYFLK